MSTVGSIEENDTTATRSFFVSILEREGAAALTVFKRFAKNNTKLAKLEARKCFLLNCRRNNVLPTHIVNDLKCVHASLEWETPFQRDIDQMITAFKKKLLNVEIKITIWRYNKLNCENNDNCATILSMNAIGSSRFLETQDYQRSRIFRHTTMSLETKLNRLIVAQTTACIGKTSEKWVHNATNVEIPLDVMMMLGLGEKHSLPVSSNKIPIYEILADTEDMLHVIDDTNKKNIVRTEVARTLESAIQKNTSIGKILQ